MALALVCGGGLWWELSNPQSRLGWKIRGVSDSVRLGATSREVWRKGTLVITGQDVDVMTRTVIGEAANEPDLGKIAVVHVILNRARQNVTWYGGNNVADVSLHKTKVKRPSGKTLTVWQFEPWMTRRDYLWNIPTSNRKYIEIRQIVLSCINGTHADPTNGATHFLEPEIVKSRRGGTLPAWAQGNGTRIGNHVFFRPRKPTV